MLPIYSALHFIPAILFKRKAFMEDPARMLFRASIGSLRSSAFLGVFIVIYQCMDFFQYVSVRSLTIHPPQLYSAMNTICTKPSLSSVRVSRQLLGSLRPLPNSLNGSLTFSFPSSHSGFRVLQPVSRSLSRTRGDAGSWRCTFCPRVSRVPGLCFAARAWSSRLANGARRC
jgi:hypothetical protein